MKIINKSRHTLILSVIAAVLIVSGLVLNLHVSSVAAKGGGGHGGTPAPASPILNDFDRSAR